MSLTMQVVRHGKTSHKMNALQLADRWYTFSRDGSPGLLFR